MPGRGSRRTRSSASGSRPAGERTGDGRGSTRTRARVIPRPRPGGPFGPARSGQELSMSRSTSRVPTIPLRGDARIPQLGFGVFQVPPRKTLEVVSEALATGYRHIDTAAAYGNEAQVGEVIRASGLERREVFVTTKCPNSDHGYEEAKRALRRSLERLAFDYVDLYLIH